MNWQQALKAMGEGKRVQVKNGSGAFLSAKSHTVPAGFVDWDNCMRYEWEDVDQVSIQETIAAKEALREIFSEAINKLTALTIRND